MSERLRPQDADEWSDTHRALLGGSVDRVASMEGRPEATAKPLNILRTIAHHPTLLEPFLAFSATLALRGVLSRRHSELLALRAAWNCRSAFEWGHHAVYARAAGLDDAEIARIASDSPAADWSEEERLLLRAADELHAHQQLSDATWSELAARYEPAHLVEIPFVIGQYTMLSMVANATGVPVEAGLPALPDAIEP